MFETISAAPPDAILGLTEAFVADSNPRKINLAVGVFKSADGATPILATVKEAERRNVEQQTSKGYKPMHGDPAYGAAVRGLLLGADSPVVESGRAITAHTPGGTGALRVAADYLAKLHPGASIWMSDPTWANHPNIFKSAGHTIKTHPYFDRSRHGLDFDAMMAGIGEIPKGDVLLLHGCCHNPTGVDPTLDQWRAIAERLAGRQITPLVDFAYQGFSQGIDEDALPVRLLADRLDELMICSSFSKNFGLYCDRVGALTVVAKSAEIAQNVLSQIKICIRTNYSNPPAHGAAIVTTVLGDSTLRARWEGEVAEMRDRINGVRRQLVDKLAAHGVKGDYTFLTRQRGMFSFSGLDRAQVQTLRDKYAVYIVSSGRINVAGITDANVDYLCEAIASVV